MEPTHIPQDKETWSFAVTILNLVGGALTGVVTAVWYFSGMKSRLENSEEKVKILNNVIFRDKGGLTFMTPEEHIIVCQSNQESFGKDLELIVKDIGHMKDTLTKIEKNTGIEDLAEMRKLMESINFKLGHLHTIDASRRVGRVGND